MKDYDPLIPDSELSKQGAFLLAQNDGCAVWQFRSGSGDGTMTVYDVFPGVMLSFNDFHMAQYESRYVASRSLFAVDHCREGRMEYAAGENAVAYIGAGDMKLDLRKQHTGVFRFPSSHYHGLTVAVDLDIVRNSLPGQIRDFPADPDRIIARWQLGDYPRVVHGVDVMEHIFGEMYRVPEKIRIPYFKVKILELLLYLDTISVPDSDGQRPYFYRSQHGAVDDVHLEAVRLFELRQPGDDVPVPRMGLPHDVRRRALVVPEHGGQLFAERAREQRPHAPRHPGIFHRAAPPHSIFTICIFIVLSPTLDRNRKNPLTDGPFRSL